MHIKLMHGSKLKGPGINRSSVRVRFLVSNSLGGGIMYVKGSSCILYIFRQAEDSEAPGGEVESVGILKLNQRVMIPLLYYRKPPPTLPIRVRGN